MSRFTLSGVVLLLLTGAQAWAQGSAEDVAKLKARIEKLEAEIAALKKEVAPGPHANLLREMAPLRQWAGSWEGEWKLAKKFDFKETAKTEWVLDGFFLQTTYTLENTTLPQKTRGLVMIAVDLEKRSFLRSEFASNGARSESVGTWDMKTRTMTWTYQTTQSKVVTTERFTDDDTIALHMVVENSRGEITSELVGQKKRRKP